MTIRRARPGEAPVLRALVERAYAPWVAIVGRRPMPMDDDYEARVAAGEAWVLEKAGAGRGVLVLEEHADHLLLDNVAVEPTQRGTGAGRALLDFAEARSRDRGLRAMQLELLVPRGWTHPSKEFLKALYGRRGYLEELKKPHVLAERVIELDTRLR